MNKIEQLKNLFRFDKQNNIDLDYYGTYRIGLTSKEIDEYLLVRSGKASGIKTLRERFYKVAGVNTCPLIEYYCDGCCQQITETLMYRHDIERFADKLFLNKETYFD